MKICLFLPTGSLLDFPVGRWYKTNPRRNGQVTSFWHGWRGDSTRDDPGLWRLSFSHIQVHEMECIKSSTCHSALYNQPPHLHCKHHAENHVSHLQTSSSSYYCLLYTVSPCADTLWWPPTDSMNFLIWTSTVWTCDRRLRYNGLIKMQHKQKKVGAVMSQGIISEDMAWHKEGFNRNKTKQG